MVRCPTNRNADLETFQLNIQYDIPRPHLHIQLCNHLNNRSIINLLSVNLHYDLLKEQTWYQKPVLIHKIHKLRYYDRFLHVVTTHTYDLPKYLTHITVFVGGDFSSIILNKH